MASSRWLSTCLAVRDGECGEGEHPGTLLQHVCRGAHRGVHMHLCVAEWGANVTILEKDSSAWDVPSSLAGFWVGLAPRLHP